MKFSTQEEYGLRCLLRISKAQKGLTIPEISQLEGLSNPNVGKILRLLRIGGFIESSRGKSGGYQLAKAPEEIVIGDVLNVLGGKFFEHDFCDTHKGVETICTNTIDCSIRSLWKNIQVVLDKVLNNTTLRDLLGTEQSVHNIMETLSE